MKSKKHPFAVYESNTEALVIELVNAVAEQMEIGAYGNSYAVMLRPRGFIMPSRKLIGLPHPNIGEFGQFMRCLFHEMVHIRQRESGYQKPPEHGPSWKRPSELMTEAQARELLRSRRSPRAQRAALNLAAHCAHMRNEQETALRAIEAERV